MKVYTRSHALVTKTHDMQNATSFLLMTTFTTCMTIPYYVNPKKDQYLDKQ